jgi:mitochondrial fission protein ELM1
MTTIWALSDGRAGIERQALAFANAMVEFIPDAEIKVIRISPKPPQIYLPPEMWFNPLGALPKEERAVFDKPPDILIANGRRAIPYSLLLKKKLGDEILTIQLQDPKVSSDKFDFVIAPKHDNVKGDNVYETLGGLVYYSQKEIDAARANYEKNKPLALVILGGDSKTHKFTQGRASEIIAQLKLVTGYQLCITTSRRTPPKVEYDFSVFARANNYEFYSPNIGGENPYLSWLASADIAFITEDSANMLSDAAFFGLPINILSLTGGSRKFDNLYQSFIQSGSAKFFNGKVFKSANVLPNNIKSIANDIVKHWQKQQN